MKTAEFYARSRSPAIRAAWQERSSQNADSIAIKG